MIVLKLAFLSQFKKQAFIFYDNKIQSLYIIFVFANSQASCTLEAGVKIYAYRVDSVHSETYKVLGGLNRTAAYEEGHKGSTVLLALHYSSTLMEIL